MRYKSFVSCMIICFFNISAWAIDTEFTIHTDQVAGPNTKFWQACGQDFLFRLVNRPMGKELLNRFQDHGSMRYMRTHYTFSNKVKLDKAAGGSIGGNIVRVDDNGQLVYDFSKVNQTFHEYVNHGIKPVVEFDFFPDQMSADFAMNVNDEGFGFKQGAPRDWQEWESMLNQFMDNLVSEFGQEELKTWYFEVWNEPDSWPLEHLDVFFKLYDVFAHVVKSHNREFKVGGPACYHLYFLRDFFEHVTHGTNYVTGETGSPIDFFSYHIYGLSGSWLENSPHLYPSVNRFTQQLLWLQRLLKNYPELKNIEFHLNEWGMSSNFQRTVHEHPQLEYRNSEESALFMIKLVDCLYAINDNYNFETKMMLYWGFNWEAEQNIPFNGNRELTTVANIPKPILTAFELLAKLGDNRLTVSGPKPGDRIGVISTKKGNKSIQLIVYNYNETDDDFTLNDDVKITLDGLKGKTVTIKSYKMDRETLNTFRTWQKMGSPASLSESQIDKLKDAGKIKLIDESIQEIHNNKAIIKTDLFRHSLVLYNACVNP